MDDKFHAILISCDKDKYKPNIFPIHDVDRFDTPYCREGTSVNIGIQYLNNALMPNITLNGRYSKSQVPYSIHVNNQTPFDVIISFIMPNEEVSMLLEPNNDINQAHLHKIYVDISHGSIEFPGLHPIKSDQSDLYVYENIPAGTILQFITTPDEGYMIVTIYGFIIGAMTTSGMTPLYSDSFPREKVNNTQRGTFKMQDSNVVILVRIRKDEEYMSEQNKNVVILEDRNQSDVEVKGNSKDMVIDHFEIPDELAKELSTLLTKQVIKERLMMQLIDEPAKYAKVEDELVPIVSRIEAIKVKITKDYVPSKYNSDIYRWNYDGYEVDGNKVSIISSVIDPNNPHHITRDMIGLGNVN